MKTFWQESGQMEECTQVHSNTHSVTRAYTLKTEGWRGGKTPIAHVFSWSGCSSSSEEPRSSFSSGTSFLTSASTACSSPGLGCWPEKEHTHPLKEPKYHGDRLCIHSFQSTLKACFFHSLSFSFSLVFTLYVCVGVCGVGWGGVGWWVACMCVCVCVCVCVCMHA